MSCTHLTSTLPAAGISNIRFRPSPPPLLRISALPGKLTCRRLRKSTTLCLFGGKGNAENNKSDNNDESSTWKSMEKSMGSLKKDNSLEEVLRQQIKKQESIGDGGDAGNPPGGGGGGGGGGGDGSGGIYDEGDSGVEELIQVVLATLGFIFVYVYIIQGQEMTRLAKDYIKYLFGGGQSVRLKRVMQQWGEFFQSITKKEKVDRYWLERAIVNTPTWWDSPTKYKRILSEYIASSKSESDDDGDDDDGDVKDDDFPF